MRTPTTVPRIPDLGTLDPPRSLAAAAAVAATLGAFEAVALVGHSGAGPLLPLIADQVEVTVAAYVFVDAALPPDDGPVELMPAELRRRLEAMAVEGILPPWNQWFGLEVMEELLPDAHSRRRVEEEIPRLPLDYFNESPPVPRGWSHALCAYLQLSPAYADAARDAQSRGWPVEHIDGSHLSTVTEPETVADRILTLLERLGIDDAHCRRKDSPRAT